VQNIIEDYKQSIPDGNTQIVYPGEGVLQKRKRHRQEGVKVLQKVWEEVLAL
jgi:LDH2 family malate/lactate/ureidoglycolate dehydrogenase